jgi:hypothetical protein
MLDNDNDNLSIMNLLYPTSPKLKWYLPVVQQTCRAFQLVDISIECCSKHSPVSPFPDGPPPPGLVNLIVQQMEWTRFPIARLVHLHLVSVYNRLK